jgi:DNA-binding transcriptional ArsR family regulator
MSQPDLFEPDDNLTITSLETLKLLSDALRARIMELLRADVYTVKQLAAVLKLPPKKLYYHVNLMEQHRLIRVVGTRLVSGITEKQYRAAAYLFLIDPSLFVASTSGSDTGLNPAFAMMFDATKNQLEQNIAAGVVDLSKDAPLTRSLLLDWSMNWMQSEQAEIFYTRLQALLEEFGAQKDEPAGPSAQAYRLLVSLYPVRRYPIPAPARAEQQPPSSA